MEERSLSEVFVLLAELAIALGEAPINQNEGCWEHAIENTGGSQSTLI